MTLKTLMIASCLMILTACAANHPKPAAIAHSGWTSISDSQMFSADAKARLKTIQDDYHLMGMSAMDHQILVMGGMMPSEKMNAMEDAIHDIVGKEFTIEMIIK